AEAMRKAVEAGRLARRAGRIPRRLYAEASTPAEGVPDLSSRPAEGTREPEGQPRQPDGRAERAGGGSRRGPWGAEVRLVRDGAGRRERLAASRLYVCTPVRPDLATFADAGLGAGGGLLPLR